MTEEEASELRDGEFIVCVKDYVYFTKGKSYMVHGCSTGVYIRDNEGRRRWVVSWCSCFLKPHEFKDIEELFEL